MKPPIMMAGAVGDQRHRLSKVMVCIRVPSRKGNSATAPASRRPPAAPRRGSAPRRRSTGTPPGRRSAPASRIRATAAFRRAGRAWPASTAMPSRSARSSICFCTSGVSTQPGQIALQVMPVVAFSSATTLVRPITPCLAATYADFLRRGDQPVHRRDVDDAAPVALLHLRQHRLDRVEVRRQVDRDHRVPALVRKLLDRRGVLDAGVVDEDVDRAEFARRRSDHVADLRRASRCRRRGSRPSRRTLRRARRAASRSRWRRRSRSA